MLKHLLKGCIAAILICMPSAIFAKTYTISVFNPFGVWVIGATAQHAKVVDFKATSEERFNLVIDIPDGGSCSVMVRLRVSAEMLRIEGRSNVCAGEGITIVRQ